MYEDIDEYVINAIERYKDRAQSSGHLCDCMAFQMINSERIALLYLCEKT